MKNEDSIIRDRARELSGVLPEDLYDTRGLAIAHIESTIRDVCARLMRVENAVTLLFKEQDDEI